MKKSLAFLFCVLFTSALFFAEDASNTNVDSNNGKDYDETTVRVIIPQNQHTTDKTASVKIEYTPMYDEVRIYYTCMYVTYDRGEAMNTVMACLEDFQKDNQYFHYRYLRRDRERYFKNDRGYNMAQYMSNVKFSR